MIDFLVSVKKQEGPQNSTILLPITIGGESDSLKNETQPIQIFLPGATHFQDVRLNKARYIVIGDFIIPEGEKFNVNVRQSFHCEYHSDLNTTLYSPLPTPFSRGQ